MPWSKTQQQTLRSTMFQRAGLRLLMLLLFLYFSYSGASELGILSGIDRKFEGHLWLGKIMGVTELFGGLALLRPEGAWGGACFLTVAMAGAVIFTVINHQIFAAVECLLMLGICVGIARWFRSETLDLF